MRVRPSVIVAAVVVAACALGALAVQRDGPPRLGDPVYKVVDWPIRRGDHPYREDIERLLNDLASRGWRFHGELSAQGARMLVFERRIGGDRSDFGATGPAAPDLRK